MEPTPPIEFGAPLEALTERLATGTQLSDEVFAELSSICRSSRDAQQLAEHARDWWPLAMH